MTLQSIVDEILMLKDSKVIKKFTERPKDKNLIPYLTRQKSLINKVNPQNETENEVNKNYDPNKNTLFEDDNFISNDDL